MAGMTNDELREVRSILMKNDYMTKVQKSGDGCIVTYPYPKLLYGDTQLPRLVEFFAIQRGATPGFWVSTTYDTTEGDRFIALPEYAMRLYIVCEIAACNSRIPLDPSLLAFFDEDDVEHEEIEEIIPQPSTEADRKHERFLYGLFVEAKNDGFLPEYGEVAETHNVGDGYEAIRRFYIQ